MSSKVFAKRNIDRVDGFDRKRPLNHECQVKPQMQPFSEDTFFTFERRCSAGKGSKMTGDMRVSTAIQTQNKRKQIFDITLRFSAEVLVKLGLKEGDRVRAQGSVNGIWHIDLSRHPMGNVLCKAHTKSASLCARFRADLSQLQALGLERSGCDIPFVECDFVEIKDDVAVFCSK